TGTSRGDGTWTVAEQKTSADGLSETSVAFGHTVSVTLGEAPTEAQLKAVAKDAAIDRSTVSYVDLDGTRLTGTSRGDGTWTVAEQKTSADGLSETSVAFGHTVSVTLGEAPTEAQLKAVAKDAAIDRSTVSYVDLDGTRLTGTSRGD